MLTIEFRVGGTIHLVTDLVLRTPYVTIDGMSAPYPGVTLKKSGRGDAGEVLVTTWPAKNTCAHDLKIAGLRFQGVWQKDTEAHLQNAATIVIDGEDLPGCLRRIRLDRLTIANSQDSGGTIWGSATEVSITRSLFVNNLHPVSISHFPDNQISQVRQNLTITDSLFAYNHERTVNIRGQVSDLAFVNNIVFAWAPFGFPGGYGLSMRCRHSTCPEKLTIAGNVFIPGETTSEQRLRDGIIQSAHLDLRNVYMAGNIVPFGTSAVGLSPQPFRSMDWLILQTDSLLSEQFEEVGAPYPSPEEQLIFHEVQLKLKQYRNYLVH